MGRWRKKLHRARKLHRPSLQDWEQDGLYETFPSFTKAFLHDDDNDDDNDNDDKQRKAYENFIPCDENAPRNLPVVLDAASLTTEEFYDHYEAKRLPCVIQNIPTGYDNEAVAAAAAVAQPTKPWPAIQRWSLEALAKDDKLMNRKLKCGEDDNGKKIKVKLKHFLSYMRENRDDSPLYIFDSTFDEDKQAKKLLQDYQVPCYFSDDLFRFISESRRPPYRWFLVGPERSGTCVHIDPLATSAWNTLIHGTKRWVLFPPQVPKRIVKGKGLIRPDEDDEAIHYFMYILPRIKRKAASLQHHDDDYQGFACYEFTQHAGETVFIPSGWWQ